MIAVRPDTDVAGPFQQDACEISRVCQQWGNELAEATQMVSYFVRYRGTSPDTRGFRDYYETQHAGILNQFSKIRSLIVHQPADCTDPFPVQRGGTLLLAQMIFDSAKDLDEALKSEARRRARDDFHLFPKFEGEITHEAMSGKVIF
ncbi:MAG: EthD family reductase [Pseudolabrys sp.]